MSRVNVDIFLKQKLVENGYAFSPLIERQLLDFLELLDRWNQVVNLTAIRNAYDSVTHHILDSLAILPFLHGKRLIDVGSGAGLPGLPLAIVQPDKEFYLLDGNRKKTHFLTQVALELQLKNVTVVHARCEQFKPEVCFDSVMTRAFSSLKEMLKLTQHLLCPSGKFLAMKGIYPESEIKEVPEKFKLLGVHDLKIKGLDQQRCLVQLALHNTLEQD